MTTQYVLYVRPVGSKVWTMRYHQPFLDLPYAQNAEPPFDQMEIPCQANSRCAWPLKKMNDEADRARAEGLEAHLAVFELPE